ncbi:MAG: bifunctional UDP-N-acetylglucosamine diphosphorylase/glucosamine-1-phosphate N-acetyltransferase GlmU [Pseudomonadota bacterium]
MPLTIVILAAGQGTRMKSMRPKVLHCLAGKPLLQHVVDSCQSLSPDQIVVVIGHGGEQVRQVMGEQLDYVEQKEQLGTGHALAQAVEQVTPGNDVLCLFGDVPLIRSETLSSMIDQSDKVAVSVLSFIPDSPFGYGRIVRNKEGHVTAIVEQKDANSDQLAITECNAGMMLIRGDRLQTLVASLDNNNAQGEYYITDLLGHAVAAGDATAAVLCDDPDEVNGVNNQQQLANVEAIYRAREAEALMLAGTKLYDPQRIDVRGNLSVGCDVEIDVNCVFEGVVTLDDHVRIGANCVIRNSHIGAGSEILPMTSIDETIIGKQVTVGPFARLRPGTECADSSKIGNFVETKKAQIGTGSKVNHLSYVGDTEMGSGVNIGAGTITCNYDGVNKHKTVIEDGVFIGSDTQLIAPVTIGQNATIGAGSTISKDSPADKLTLSRSKQITMNNWSKPTKKQKDS